MLYLLAIVGTIVVFTILWRLLGADSVEVGAQRRRTIAPDDDPEFLRSLRDRRNNTDSDGN
ncbi:MAG: hypothetical protein ACRDQ1_00355 [Sciscionella sp.]